MADETAPDPRERYGRLFHAERLAVNAELEHPRGVLPWEERHPMQQEMDMRGAAAVAAQAVADADLDGSHALVAEIRRRARVWAALPDGAVARIGRELLRLTHLQDRDRGEEKGRDDD
jgi:hypothetical protein